MYPIEDALQPVADEDMAAAEDDQEQSSCDQGESIEENTGSVAMSAPVQPTKKMIEYHEVSHIPFRSWCAACVRGRAKSAGHRTKKDRVTDVTTFSVDYGFFGSPGETPLQSVSGKDLPVLIAYDRKSGGVFAHPVPHKGLVK